MNRSLRRTAAVSALALLASAWAQEAPAPTLESLDAELARIGVQREQANARLDAEDAACLSVFAVTDCQNKVTVRRRAQMADFKRQETAVKDAQRRLRAQEQLQRTADKATEAAQRQAEIAAQPASETEADRQRTQDEKIQAHQRQAQPAPPKASGPKLPSGLDAQEQARNRAAYEEKQRAVQKRREDRDQRVQEKGSGDPPLPTAP